MCRCAVEAVECMNLPGVAGLCCPTESKCCDSLVSLDTISDEIKEAFDDGGPDAATVAGATEIELTVLNSAAKAIRLAAARISQHVCMAKYASDCVIKARICLPASCCCTCKCRSCDTCDRESVCLDRLPRCVHPSRIETATLDGNPISVDGSLPDADIEVITTGSTWLLYGAPSGVHTLCFNLKESRCEWDEALLSFACKRVRCVHGTGCNVTDMTITATNDGTTREQYTWVQASKDGMIEDKFALDLDQECCQKSSGLSFGGVPGVVDWIRWDKA